MHATLWFDKLHKQEIFSISTRVTEVGQRLLSIKPPSYIARLPRSLSEITLFKAAGLMNFLLFYSFPCLIGILPQDQFYHFSRSWCMPHTFFRKKSLPRTLMLMEFVINIPALYGERYSNSNVHLLLHLTDRVADVGHLWSTSCFYFEDFNGQLQRLFHRTQSCVCGVCASTSSEDDAKIALWKLRTRIFQKNDVQKASINTRKNK